MPAKKRKVLKRIVIDVYEFSDEFGDVVENISIAVEHIEGLYDYEVKEQKV